MPPYANKEEFVEFARAKAHKDSAPKHFSCIGANHSDCPCKGCLTARSVEAAKAEWDKDPAKAAAKEHEPSPSKPSTPPS